MKHFLAIALVMIAATTSFAAEKRVKDVVKHFDNMRIVYAVSQDGTTIPVITNLDKNGKPMGPRVAPAPDWNRAYRTTLGARVAPRNENNIQSNGEIQNRAVGIPIHPGRSPQRAINPYKPVNPFTDPTAIPTTPH